VHARWGAVVHQKESAKYPPPCHMSLAPHVMPRLPKKTRMAAWESMRGGGGWWMRRGERWCMKIMHPADTSYAADTSSSSPRSNETWPEIRFAGLDEGERGHQPADEALVHVGHRSDSAGMSAPTKLQRDLPGHASPPHARAAPSRGR
jgi:hypothetical protein